jgi:glycosyltransferase A (GT-A) superfamily protein (DUF2064 family)
LKRLQRRVFENIDWSTEHVFEQTKARATEIGVKVHELSPGFDVDDRATLARLCAELLEGESKSDIAMETRRFLKEIIEKEGRDRICAA